MVIAVNGAADGAQRVMAVGQHIRDWEVGHAGRFCRLHNADKSDVVRGEGIKLQLEPRHIAGGVVRVED